MGSDVGENVKVKRKELHLSQVRLSQLSGISQSAISDIENPDVTKRPNTDTIAKLAAALNCTVAELMGEESANEKKLSAESGELDEKLVNLLVNLSDEDVQRVRDFVSGLIAARTK